MLLLVQLARKGTYTHTVLRSESGMVLWPYMWPEVSRLKKSCPAAERTNSISDRDPKLKQMGNGQ